MDWTDKRYSEREAEHCRTRSTGDLVKVFFFFVAFTLSISMLEKNE
jgi:hypothetical protein